MAAGQGFKTFATGEVLSAADVNGYLMQGVLVFANSAERDSEITSPQEGQFAYLKDTNVTTYYTGSAWANLDTTGMTNPMTTTGDTIYSSSGSTPARLGIGSTGNVLTVAGGVPTWAAPAGASSNFTVLNSGGTTLSGSSTSITGISGKSNLRILVDNAQLSSSYTWLYFTINNDTTDANYLTVGSYIYPGASYSAGIFQIFDSFLGHPGIPFGKSTSSGTPYLSGGATISGGNSSGYKVVQTNGASAAASGNANAGVAAQSYYTGSSTISSIQIRVSGGTMSGGTVYILGSDN